MVRKGNKSEGATGALRASAWFTVEEAALLAFAVAALGTALERRNDPVRHGRMVAAAALLAERFGAMSAALAAAGALPGPGIEV